MINFTYINAVGFMQGKGFKLGYLPQGFTPSTSLSSGEVLWCRQGFPALNPGVTARALKGGPGFGPSVGAARFVTPLRVTLF